MAEEFKNQGNECFKNKDYSGAVDAFTNAIKLDKKNEAFFSNRSAAYTKLKDFAKAVEDAETAVKLKPDWGKGYVRLGSALVAKGEFDKAIDVFETGITKEPSNELLVKGLADAHKAKAGADDGPKKKKASKGGKDVVEEKSAVDHVIGIDLGTTNSCVGVWEGDGIRIIANQHGDRTIPSYVAFDGDTRHVGATAKNQVTRNPTNTVYDVKRIIGQRFSESGVEQDCRRFPFKVEADPDSDAPKIVVQTKKGEAKFAPEEISAMVLSYCKKVAEDYLKTTVTKAVITVPAYFNDSQRQATKAAGAIAGLEVLRIINEPTAAALAYGLDAKSAKKGGNAEKVLVFDLGGGTFDVSILNIEGGVFTVLATGGDTHLGGEDFDNLVVDYFITEMEKQGMKDPKGDHRQMQRLRKAAEMAKRELSNAISTNVRVDDLQNNKNFAIKLTREKFNYINRTRFNMCIETVQKVLKDSKCKTTDMSEVILVGGSTRIPKIQEMLAKFFDKSLSDLCKSVNPDEAVAYGAAVQGAILNGSRNAKTDDILLMDVTPLSLGIETTGRVMSVIIPRNTAIPCQKTQVYTTEHNYQTKVDVAVYEGERLKSDENNLLGEFTISGIENAKRGEPQVDVMFSLDSNGILNVTAKDQKTGAEAKITITNRSKASDSEIKKMVEEAERFRKEDQERLRKVEAKNELEAIIFEVLDMAAEMEDRKLAGILEEAANKEQMWLEENYEDAKTAEIAVRRRNLDRRIAGKRQ